MRGVSSNMRTAPRNSNFRADLERKPRKRGALTISLKKIRGARAVSQVVLAVTTYFAIFVAAFLDALGTTDFERLTWLLIVLQSARFSLVKTWDSLTLSLGVAFFALFALPSIGMIVFEANPPIQTLAVFIVVFDMMRNFGGRAEQILRKRTAISGKRLPLLFGALQTWMLVSPFVFKENALITLIAPLSVSAVVLEVMLRERKKKVAYWALTSTSVILLSYVTFHWSGFGRLVVGSYLLFIVFVISRYVDIGFRLWIVPLLLPFALFFAQISRYGNVDDLRTLIMGSAAHHLIVTSDAKKIADAGSAQGWGEFMDQYALMFLSWFPRSVWPDKPLGAGLTSVDEMYGRTGLAAHYTQSLGFLGDQYYLLGTSAFIGLFIAVATLVILRRIIASQSSIFYSPLAAYDVSLISFFWGGMATFGSRVWFLVVPGLLLIVLHRIRLRSKPYAPSAVNQKI